MDHPVSSNGAVLSPLDVLLTLMRDLWTANDHTAAANIAKLAAPYVHARAASGPVSTPRSATLSAEEIGKWVEEDDASADP